MRTLDSAEVAQVSGGMKFVGLGSKNVIVCSPGINGTCSSYVEGEGMGWTWMQSGNENYSPYGGSQYGTAGTPVSSSDDSDSSEC